MENLVNKIYQYLDKENIQVLSFFRTSSEEVTEDRVAELSIKINNEDRPKWDYFVSRLNNDKLIASVEYFNDGCKFIFSSKDNELLEEKLGEFYFNLLQKYYLVCPKVENFAALIKPTHRCNLDCKYCYDKPFREKIKEDMTIETLDRFVSFLSKHSKNVKIIWHGGEPTVVGLNWYKDAFEKVFTKYPMTNFTFDMMTNGVLLNDEWVEYLRGKKVSIGVSYNSKYQSYLRCISQDGSYDEKNRIVKDNIEDIIIKHKIPVIEVITKANYKNQIDIYEYYKEIGCKVSFNQIFRSAETQKNNLEVDAKDYAYEFLKFFKHWLFDKNGIRERIAAEMLNLVIGGSDVTCKYRNCRYSWLGINPVGDLYPCSRHYPEKYNCGNVWDYESIEEVFKSSSFKVLSDEVDKRIKNKCMKCGYLNVCRGGCSSIAIAASGNAEGVDEFTCEVFRQTFIGVYEMLRDIDLNLDIDKLNPAVREIIENNNFYSVKEIKTFMNEFGINLHLEYDPERLLGCSEYVLFRGINYQKSCTEKYGDTENCSCDLGFDQSKRKEKLYEYLANIAKKITKKDA